MTNNFEEVEDAIYNLTATLHLIGAIEDDTYDIFIEREYHRKMIAAGLTRDDRDDIKKE